MLLSGLFLMVLGISIRDAGEGESAAACKLPEQKLPMLGDLGLFHGRDLPMAPQAVQMGCSAQVNFTSPGNPSHAASSFQPPFLLQKSPSLGN